MIFGKNTWNLTATETTKATPETIWAWYEKTDLAPIWDPLVAKIKLNGPFEKGTTGVNTAPNRMNFNLIFTEVTKYKSYTEVTRLVGANMAFIHTIIQNPNQTCSVTHEVICRGVLSWFYELIIRKEYEKKFPLALKNLAELCDGGLPDDWKKKLK